MSALIRRLQQKEAATLKSRDFDLEVKSIDDDGVFKGYGSVFGTIDSYREVVAKGAFVDSLKELKAKKRRVPILYQHRSGQPMGVYDVLEEDEKGLYVEGRLLKEDVAVARETYALMKAGALSGLSIGYYVRSDSYDEKERIRTLTQLDLVEISVVTFPANDDARIDMIKSKLAHGELPDLPEFERFLREAGFSKTQSAVIATRGLKHLLHRSESESAPANVDPDAIKAVQSAINGFSLQFKL